MVSRVFTDPRPQQFRSDGVTVNSAGKLYFYEPGAGSTTLKDVYSSSALTTKLPNPVVIPSSGRTPTIYMQDSDYAVRHTDSGDNQIWRVDNYQPKRFETEFQDWNATFTYAVNSIVRYTDGNYYISLISSNLGQTPSTTSASWSQLAFFEAYNASKTYGSGAVVFSNNSLWISKSLSNLGNTPSIASIYWAPPGARPSLRNSYEEALSSYYRDDATAQKSIEATAVAANNAWESYGPASSSPDNTWSDLDDLLTTPTPKSILLGVKILASKTTGADANYDITVQARKNGGTAFFEAGFSAGFGGATNNSQIGGQQMIEVPLSSNGLFDLRYINNSADTATVTLFYYGYRAFSTDV